MVRLLQIFWGFARLGRNLFRLAYDLEALAATFSMISRLSSAARLAALVAFTAIGLILVVTTFVTLFPRSLSGFVVGGPQAPVTIPGWSLVLFLITFVAGYWTLLAGAAASNVLAFCYAGIALIWAVSSLLPWQARGMRIFLVLTVVALLPVAIVRSPWPHGKMGKALQGAVLLGMLLFLSYLLLRLSPLRELTAGTPWADVFRCHSGWDPEILFGLKEYEPSPPLKPTVKPWALWLLSLLLLGLALIPLGLKRLELTFSGALQSLSAICLTAFLVWLLALLWADGQPIAEWAVSTAQHQQYLVRICWFFLAYFVVRQVIEYSDVVMDSAREIFPNTAIQGVIFFLWGLEVLVGLGPQFAKLLGVGHSVWPFVRLQQGAPSVTAALPLQGLVAAAFLIYGLWRRFHARLDSKVLENQFFISWLIFAFLVISHLRYQDLLSSTQKELTLISLAFLIWGVLSPGLQGGAALASQGNQWFPQSSRLFLFFGLLLTVTGASHLGFVSNSTPLVTAGLEIFFGFTYLGVAVVTYHLLCRSGRWPSVPDTWLVGLIAGGMGIGLVTWLFGNALVCAGYSTWAVLVRVSAQELLKIVALIAVLRQWPGGSSASVALLCATLLALGVSVYTLHPFPVIPPFLFQLLFGNAELYLLQYTPPPRIDIDLLDQEQSWLKSSPLSSIDVDHAILVQLLPTILAGALLGRRVSRETSWLALGGMTGLALLASMGARFLQQVSAVVLVQTTASEAALWIYIIAVVAALWAIFAKLLRTPRAETGTREVAGTRKRPVGLMLIIINTFLGGILGPLVLKGSPLTEGSLFLPRLVFFILLGILYLIAGYGLWRLRKWGLTLAMVLYVVSIPQTALNIFLTKVTLQSVVEGVVGILLTVIIVKYLLKPAIRSLFE